MNSEYTGFEVAIIGMAGRFPGSKNVKELWENLCNGKDLISHFSDEELKLEGISDEYLEDKNYVKAKGIIEDPEGFDAGFFNMYPKESESLDPQQRLFLECSWEAMEDAGYIPDECDGSVGVFGGIGMNTYIMQHLQNFDIKTSAEAYQLSLGNDKDFVTTRVSYKLNLNGPSIDIQSACSTSLVAVHVACMNLLNYQCDLAIAGGATISFPNKAGYHYQEGMILSHDGFCRPFDKNASGTVASNGVGIVVLKRLEDAFNDGDDIYAIIKGSAYNNDGAIKVGYTAPSVNGQVNVISSAKSVADIPYESIGYIETHGTGTSLGDPIEVEALNEAFRVETEKKQFCAIGSIKSNLGHLDAAAGVTGLIKAALSLYHKKLVPSINYDEPNSQINFSETPFYLNTGLKDWDRNSYPLRAAVSSFGIGGTNVHAILEESPIKNKNEFGNQLGSILIPISAYDSKSLQKYENDVSNFIKKSDDYDALAFHFQKFKKSFNFRGYSIFSKDESNKDKMKLSFKNNDGEILDNPEVVFMFSGQGSQYINMCKGLYDENKIFQKYLDSCLEIFKKNHNLNLKDLLFPNTSDVKNSERLKQTEITQPALFSIEYSLAKTFMEYGIIPKSMVGHSIGEYTAACIAEVFSLEDAINIVYYRGNLMQKLVNGSMLSVQLPENELLKLIPDTLDLAVINSPNSCVISGSNNEIEKFKTKLDERRIVSTILHTSHAFHSRMMDPVLSEFNSLLNNVKYNPPKIPYMSNISGREILDEEATSSNYYVNHLRYTVRFSDNIINYDDKKNKIFLEIGPGKVLTSLAKQSTNGEGYFINSVRQDKQNNVKDTEVFLSSLGQLWLRGVKINWDNFYDESPNKIHVPTYPFNKKRYSLKYKESFVKAKRQIQDFLYEQTWKKLSKITNKQLTNNYNNILVVCEETDNLDYLEDLFNSKLTILNYSEDYSKVNDYSYKLNFSNKRSVTKFTNELSNDNRIPDLIINTLFLNKDDNYSEHYLLFMRLISNLFSEIKTELEIIFLTNMLFDLFGNETIVPEKSLILGAVRVTNQEYKNVNTKLIDFNEIDSKNIYSIKNVLNFEGNNLYAVRGNSIWVPHYENIKLFKEKSIIKKHGNYIITGGLGKIGLAFADVLAEKYHADITLIDRIDIPERENWEALRESNDENNLLEKIIEIENKSDSLKVIKCDITDREKFLTVLNKLQQNKAIDGIIHAAGIIGDKTLNLINNFDSENYWLQYNPKILGLKNIIEFTEENSPRFVLVQSSLSSILGGTGFCNYSAINNLIDNIVLSLNNQKTKWISADWDAWKFSDNVEGLLVEEGKKVFEMILNSDTPSNLIISKNDLSESIERWTQKITPKLPDINLNDIQERPELSTDYIQPEDDIEKEIYEEWKKLLGIEKIGVEDNFFELGGDSLIGTQLVSRIRNKFNSELPLTAVFENATIRGIANLIKNDSKNNKQNEVNDVLSMIENMSDEEAASLLKEKSDNNG